MSKTRKQILAWSSIIISNEVSWKFPFLCFHTVSNNQVQKQGSFWKNHIFLDSISFQLVARHKKVNNAYVIQKAYQWLTKFLNMNRFIFPYIKKKYILSSDNNLFFLRVNRYHLTTFISLIPDQFFTKCVYRYIDGVNICMGEGRCPFDRHAALLV